MTRRDAAGVLAAALVVAVTAVLSASTLATAGADGSRVGILSFSASAIGFAILSGVVVAWLASAGASLAPLSLLVLLVLPWLPLPVPPVLLLWAGSIRWLVWGAVLCVMVATVKAP